MPKKAEGARAPRAQPRARMYFPLRLKVAMIIVATLLPVGVFLYVRGAPLWQNQNTVFGALAFGLISVVLGLVLAEGLVVEPMKRAVKFFLGLRDENFASVPVLPRVGSDEIGEMARQMAYASVRFARLKEESEEAVELKSLFLMTAAHQLRTPLTELMWAMDDLRNPGTAAADKDKLLASVDSTLKRMHLVTEHILASARVGEGRFGYVFAPVDMGALMEKLVLETQPLSARHRVPVALQKGALPQVYADAERISLVLFDLIANSLQYTPAGGSVVLSAAPKGEDLEIAVTDNGIGIAPEERANLFNKFYRGERARHMHPDGSGLGLYLAREIVREHGSDIVIESQEGKGTRVSFLLHTRRDQVHR